MAQGLYICLAVFYSALKVEIFEQYQRSFIIHYRNCHSSGVVVGWAHSPHSIKSFTAPAIIVKHGLTPEQYGDFLLTAVPPGNLPRSLTQLHSPT